MVSIIKKKKKGVSAAEIARLSELKVERVFNEKWLGNSILHPRPQRPGLALTGYFKYLNQERIQIFGKTEMGYLNQLKADERPRSLKSFLALGVPAIIVTESQELDPEFTALADRAHTPILVSKLQTALLISRISSFLYQYFSEKIKINGVLMDIMGQGAMITGPSGIGKSETALELIHKGHHLIADDVIEFYLDPNDDLIGRPHETNKNWIEVRGLGIINIPHILGASAVLTEKKLDLVIQLEKWDPKKNYDRLGEENRYFTMLGIDIPMVSLPVAPGRNVSTIIEVAVRYFIARKNGTQTFLELKANAKPAKPADVPPAGPASQE